jgi:ABC-type branched-subunit amino acid transport system permease subunit
LLALPAFWTGEPAEDTLERQAAVSENLIEQHEESAELALVAALATSGLAALGWFVTRRKEAWLAPVTKGTAVAVILTSGLMAWVGHEGGKIRHPEISDGSPGDSTQDQNVSSQSEKDDNDD